MKSMRFPADITKAYPKAKMPTALLDVLKSAPASFESARAVYFYINATILHRYTYQRRPWTERMITVGVFEHHHVRWFFVNPWRKDYESFLDPYLRKASLLADLERLIAGMHARAVESLTNVPDAYSTQRLVATLRRGYRVVSNLFSGSIAARNIDRGIQAHFQRIYGDRKAEQNTALAYIAIPRRIPVTTLEELAIAKIAALRSHPRARLQRLYDTYCWISCGYFNEPAKTLQQYEVAVLSTSRKNPREHLAALLQRRTNDLQEQKKFLASFSPQTRKIARLAGTTSWLKDYFKFSINHVLYLLEPYFQEAARRTGYSIEQFKDLFPSEAIALLGGKHLAVEELLQERRNGSVLIGYPDTYILLTGTQAKAFERQYIRQQRRRTILRGRPACPGKVRGIIRVIREHREFLSFKKGEILVAVNTSPDFVPLMRKASAIITEEGGLTSHASVVSRELGVPCVVGVLDATRVLRSGIRVEVDASKGIVRKLEPAE